MTTPCPRCGRDVTRARTASGTNRAYEATPHGGTAIITQRDRARWYQLAIPNPTGAWRPHHCPGRAGEQLEFSTEAAITRPTIANSQES